MRTGDRLSSSDSNARSKTTAWTKITAGFALLLAGAAFGWAIPRFLHPAAPQATTEQEEKATGEHEADHAGVKVEAAPAAKGVLITTTIALGRVLADDAAVIGLSSRASGRVIEVGTVAGRDVGKGDLICKIDPAPQLASLVQLRATLEQAENALAEFDAVGKDRERLDLQAAKNRSEVDERVARAQVARLEPLLKDGLIAERELFEAQQEVQRKADERDAATRTLAAFTEKAASFKRAALASSVTSARAAVADAELVLTECTVAAPAAGRITALVPHVGDRIEAGTSLGSILLPGRLIAFAVPAPQVARIAVGSTATFGDSGSGAVVAIGHGVSAAGMVDVIVVPAPGDPPLRPGLVVRGELESGRIADALLVPEAAILRAEDEQVVVTIQDGHSHRVPVKILGRARGRIAIDGEIAPGTLVIVDGGYNLPDDTAVVAESPESRAAESAPAGERK